MYSTIGYGIRHNPNFTYNIHPPQAPTKVPKNAAFPECIAAGQQNKIWGEIYTLKGQISSVHLFNDSLSQSVLSDLFLAGRLHDSLPRYHPSSYFNTVIKTSEGQKYPYTDEILSTLYGNSALS